MGRPRGPRVSCVCEFCAASFEVLPSAKKRGGGRFCSRECSSGGDAEFRLRNEVSIDKATGCINWLGSLSSSGYGSIKYRGKSYKTHRLAYELKHGPIESTSLYVCHHCDNPVCINTDHLFLGTHNDNIQDAVRKGRTRSPKGEESGKAKITSAHVLKIRASKLSVTKLAETMPIARSQIWNIKTRKSWKHIP